MKKLKAIWELMRLEHGIMIALAILVGSLIAAMTLPVLDKFILAFFTALFLEGSTFALNDYYDLDIDKKNILNQKDVSMRTQKIIIILFTLIFIAVTSNLLNADETSQKFEQPLLISSAGQNAEIQLVSVLAKRAGIQSNLVKSATDEDLGNNKTLALVLGASMKGLGAAGLDMKQEKERIDLLINSAKKMNIPIVMFHLGGEARRGDLSDKLIRDLLPYSQLAVVTKAGNKDGLFSEICIQNNIPLIEIERTVQALDPLKKIFKSP